MKRSEALQPLSRDHHLALVAAQRLRRAVDADEARRQFLEFWRGHGSHHFRVEEEVLLPLWARHGAADDPVVARVLTDHVAIRSEVGRLEGEGLAEPELRALGERLQEHVRLEEEELFPLIERTLDRSSLEALAAAVLEAEGGLDGGSSPTA